MGRAGIEPAKDKPADLQSAPFNHLDTYPFKDNLKITFANQKINDIMLKNRLYV